MAFTRFETAVAAFVTWFTRICKSTTAPGSEKSVVEASLTTWVVSVLRVLAICVMLVQTLEFPKSGTVEVTAIMWWC